MIRSSNESTNDSSNEPQNQNQASTDQHQQQQHQQSQSQNQDDSSKPKRNPFCSRCRNHGKSAQVKGHKRHCEYRYCQCEGCHLVEMRQIVSARQIKRRRYQKQDEECGRNIEVSPPVLTREPDSNLATLIAKTLIGGGPPAKGMPVTYKNHQQLHSSLQNGPALPPIVANDSQRPHTLIGSHQSMQQLPLSHLSPKQEHHPLTAGNSPVSSALNNALQLFHFPANFTGQPPGGILMPPAPSSSSAAAAASTSRPLPGIREQITLVEEIYDSFGQLAIYAWLRSENFDLRKIRNLIELSRVPFDELLQIASHWAGHSPLDLTNPIVD